MKPDIQKKETNLGEGPDKCIYDPHILKYFLSTAYSMNHLSITESQTTPGTSHCAMLSWLATFPTLIVIT